MNVLRFGCPRGQSAAPHGWTGSTEQLAHDLQGGLVRQTALHDRRVGHLVIGHVSGSDQVGRVLHEVINICILGERLRESCTLCRESEVCVEN